VNANASETGAVHSSLGEDQPIARVVEHLLDLHHPQDRVALRGAPAIRLPDHIRDAVRRALDATYYAPSMGEPALRRAIANRLSQEGTAVTPDQVLVTNGAMHALDLVFRTLLTVGDEVLMARPGFFIDGLVQRAGGKLRFFDSSLADGFRPSWIDAARQVSTRTRILYVNSPVNPTGYVYDEADISSAMALAHDSDIWIVSDESLAHFVYGGLRHQSPLQRPDGAARTIVVRSFSKDYAMPGWRIGYAVLPLALMPAALAMLEWTTLSVNSLAQAAALAALTGPQDWVARVVQEAAEKGVRFADALNEVPGIECIAPRGGLNIFPRFHGDADALARRLVVDFGVPASPGTAFGWPGHLRFQFGGPSEAIEIAIHRIRTAVESGVSVASSADGIARS
jgi:aspartate aminotransferase